MMVDDVDARNPVKTYFEQALLILIVGVLFLGDANAVANDHPKRQTYGNTSTGIAKRGPQNSSKTQTHCNAQSGVAGNRALRFLGCVHWFDLICITWAGRCWIGRTSSARIHDGGVNNPPVFILQFDHQVNVRSTQIFLLVSRYAAGAIGVKMQNGGRIAQMADRYGA